MAATPANAPPLSLSEGPGIARGEPALGRVELRKRSGLMALA
jgi:hypothetical protein